MENFGYDIITQKEFDKLILNEDNELNEYFNNEKFELQNVKEHINYECNIINNIIKNEDDIIEDIEYESNDINLSYLEWYYTKDYQQGMNWYIDKYPNLPGINNLAYILVKQDLTGKNHLEKWEKHIIKKQLKKDKTYYDNITKERNRCIKKLIKAQNEKLKTMKVIKKKILVDF